MSQFVRSKRPWLVGVACGALMASLIALMGTYVLPSSADDSATSDPPRDVFIERVEGPGGEPGGPGDVEPADRPRPFGPGEKGAPPPHGWRLSEEDRERVHAAIKRFAACMREQGVDLPDPPEPGKEGARGKRAFFIRRHGDPGKRPSEAEWQKLRAAHEKCEQHLPKHPR